MKRCELLATAMRIANGCGLFWMIVILGIWLLFGASLLDAARAAIAKVEGE